MPTLKRGWGRIFCGENWRLANPKKWHDSELHVPSGMEKYVGEREIDGLQYSVFRCLNDNFLAQLVTVCELPGPTDPVEILSVPPYKPNYDSNWWTD